MPTQEVGGSHQTATPLMAGERVWCMCRANPIADRLLVRGYQLTTSARRSRRRRTNPIADRQLTRGRQLTTGARRSERRRAKPIAARQLTRRRQLATNARRSGRRRTKPIAARQLTRGRQLTTSAAKVDGAERTQSLTGYWYGGTSRRRAPAGVGGVERTQTRPHCQRLSRGDSVDAGRPPVVGAERNQLQGGRSADCADNNRAFAPKESTAGQLRRGAQLVANAGRFAVGITLRVMQNRHAERDVHDRPRAPLTGIDASPMRRAKPIPAAAPTGQGCPVDSGRTRRGSDRRIHPVIAARTTARSFSSPVIATCSGSFCQ